MQELPALRVAGTTQGKYEVLKVGECNNVRAHKERKREEELAGLQRDFALKKEKLRSLVEDHNLRDADPLGESAFTMPVFTLSTVPSVSRLHSVASAA